MRELLIKVNELLNKTNMQIQAKKSIVVSNFECGDFVVKGTDNEEQKITKIKQDETFKYLGALFSIKRREVDTAELENDIKRSIEKMSHKRMSVKNAQYIINAVMIPKIVYRLSGAVIGESKIDHWEQLLRGYMKRLLKLPRAFPTRYLHSAEYLVNVKKIRDSYEEQEMNNMFCIMQKRTLPGILVNRYLDKLQRCHPVFAGPKYETKSKMINQVWKIIDDRNVEIVNNEKWKEVQTRAFSCQYIGMEDHDVAAENIERYNLRSISSMYTMRRQKITLKKFNETAIDREIRYGAETNSFWQHIEEKTERIVREIDKGALSNIIHDISTFENEIMIEFNFRIGNSIIRDTIWTDGSFSEGKLNGGTAVVVEKENGETVIFKDIFRIFRTRQKQRCTGFGWG